MILKVKGHQVKFLGEGIHHALHCPCYAIYSIKVVYFYVIYSIKVLYFYAIFNIKVIYFLYLQKCLTMKVLMKIMEKKKKKKKKEKEKKRFVLNSLS